MGGAGIAQVLNLPLAVAATETLSTKGLVTGENGKVLNLVAAGIAAVGTIAADQGPIAQEEEVRVRIEESAACAAAKTIDVPSLPSCEVLE